MTDKIISDAIPKNIKEEAQQKKIDKEMLKQSFEVIFSSKAGQQVLEHLQKAFLERPVCFLEIDNRIHTAFFREGENNVVRYIKKMSKKS